MAARSDRAHAGWQNTTMDANARSQVAAELATAGVPVLAVVFAVATIAGPGQASEDVTRLPQLSPVFQGLDVVAGISAIVAGSLAWIAGRRGTGLASVLAGVCWFGADWAGDASAPGGLRAAGLVAVVLTLPMLALAVLATRPYSVSRVARSALLGTAAGLVGLTAFWLVVWVPALDPRCLAICNVNPIGEGLDFQLARTLANAWQGLTVAVGVGTAAWALRRLALVSGPARRRRGPLLGGAVLVGAAWAAWGVSLMLPSTLVAPAGQVAVVLFIARGIAMTALAAGLGWWTFNLQETLEAIKRLADRMAPFPGAGALTAGLADAFADPHLRLVYALPGEAGFVEADGQSADIDADARLEDRVTEIRRGHEVVAIAIRSSEAAGEPVAPVLDAAVQLAADNERLLASVRHEVLELRASRARIVETGDAARRQLERDLHDGAQQRMLGIVHDLSIVRAMVTPTSDSRAAALAVAIDDADATIEALRALARGIHPAILEEAGLAAAVEALADEAPLPVIIEGAPDTRFDPTAESAALRLVSRCLADAARLGAASVKVGFAVTKERLAVRIEISGLTEALDTVSLADVIGAAGGDLISSGVLAGMMRIRADLPCG